MSTAPPLTGLPVLPKPRMHLIGRARDVTAVRELLHRDHVQLVTLLGPGGVGKTRLALEVVHDVGDGFPDGVAFVSLAPVRDPALVLPTIVRTLGVSDRGTPSPLERMAGLLDGRRLLLVLDNLEQVATMASQLVDLLARCPALTILATSRIALRVTGEYRYQVSPLGLPDLARLPAQDELATTEAVALFIQRAQAEDPEFTLTPANAPAVAEICTRVDGLPLAIELAAARLRVLSPEGLLARLGGRLRLLTGGERDQPARLQTMRDAIAWSHDLLSPIEQTLFRRLSVFVGDFTLEAAESAAGGDDVDVDVVDALAALVDQSLVRRIEQAESEPRFGMLETIREFALEQLVASGEAADLRSRHLAYYLEMAEQADRVPFSPTKEAENRLLEQELPNLRAALEWAADQPGAVHLMRLVVALWGFWEGQLSVAEICRWADRAVAATTHVPPELHGLRARLLAYAAAGEILHGSTAGAESLLDEALTMARRSEDIRAKIDALIGQGDLAIARGELDRAEAPLREALASSRAASDPDMGFLALFRLGYMLSLRGEVQASESTFSECLAIARAGGWQVSIAYSLEALGTAARKVGDSRRAAGLFAEALTLVRDLSDFGCLANCVRSLGAIAAMVGDAMQAARLFGAEQALSERQLGCNYSTSHPERAHRDRDEALARDALPPDQFAAAWAAGRALSLDQAIAEAYAVAEAVSGDHSSSRTAAAGLTPREVEVLRLLVEGHSDREIADTLFVSRHTAANHVGNILSKLGVPSRAAAAAWAVRHGLA